jgi:protease I
MAKVAVIIDDMFEDSEYTDPVNAFKKAGHETVNVGLEKDKEVKGKKQGTVVKVDEAAKDANAKNFDALLILGGYSPDRLRAYDEPVKFVKDFMAAAKPVFAICHGPQILITAGALKGRKVTCYKSLIEDVKNAGAEYSDVEVLVDGNLVTSRQPSDIPAFIERALKKLQGSKIPDMPPCERTATGEHARTFDEGLPCKEQDV